MKLRRILKLLRDPIDADEAATKAYVDANAGGGGTGGGHTISDEGTDLPARSRLNFTGAGVAATDDSASGRTNVSVPGGVSDHGALTGLDQNHHPHYQLRSERGAAGGYAPLDAGSRVPEQHIPAAALGLPYEVASEAAMLALTVEPGDVAIRSDVNKSYMLRAAPASTLANWAELRTPTDQVLSVNGRTGAVSLSDSYAPLAHKARHATGSADALTPSDIGAAPASHVGTGGSAHANATSTTAGFMSAADKVLQDPDLGCALALSTPQTISSSTAWVGIRWDTEVADPKGWHSETNPERIYPGAAGVYLVSIQTAWESNTANFRGHGCEVNGAQTVSGGISSSNLPNMAALQGNGLMSSTFQAKTFSATDYIVCYGRQNSGVNLAMNTQCNVTITRIR